MAQAGVIRGMIHIDTESSVVNRVGTGEDSEGSHAADAVQATLQAGSAPAERRGHGGHQPNHITAASIPWLLHHQTGEHATQGWTAPAKPRG